jgi:diadenosine tetraphosphate (Ap4A) HIT family hydrolase
MVSTFELRVVALHLGVQLLDFPVDLIDFPVDLIDFPVNLIDLGVDGIDLGIDPREARLHVLAETVNGGLQAVHAPVELPHLALEAVHAPVELPHLALEPVHPALEPVHPAPEPVHPALEPADLALEPADLTFNAPDLALEPADLALEPADLAAEPLTPTVHRAEDVVKGDLRLLRVAALLPNHETHDKDLTAPCHLDLDDIHFVGRTAPRVRSGPPRSTLLPARMGTPNDSPLLQIPRATWTHENTLAFAAPDPQPITAGHTLIITKRRVPTWFDATLAEHHALLALLAEVKATLDSTLHPDGYNVGFNAGPAAGDTTGHLHLHVIPRFHGDVDDPRGGIRNLLSPRAHLAPSPLATGGTDDPFARHILPLLNPRRPRRHRRRLHPSQRPQTPGARADRRRGSRRPGPVVTGDYLEITQVEALERLLDLQSGIAPDPNDASTGRLEARVIESRQLPHATRSFHPKSWWFESSTFGVAFVGSSNLSYAALRTGIEWNLRVDRARDPRAYARVRSAFEDLWQRAAPLTAPWIQAYAVRAALRPNNLPPGEVDLEPVPRPSAPHEVQQEALAQLPRSREQGRRRAGDLANIPWRNRRFDPELLADATDIVQPAGRAEARPASAARSRDS